MRILVLEDENVIRTYFADALKERGHQVEQAVDGGTALAYLDGPPFDVVVLDIVTPRMSGLEFLVEASRRGRHCPVVAVTAYDPQHCAGIEDIAAVLQKPVTGDVLVRTVEALQEGSR